LRLPRLVLTTPFRLTMLFLVLFMAGASAFLGYIYMATAREAASLEEVYRRGGFTSLNQAVIERASSTRSFLYLVMAKSGAPISGSIAVSPIDHPPRERVWASFRLSEMDADGHTMRRPARGLEERLSGGVASDVSRNMNALTEVINAARLGDLAARARVRGAGDELDVLAMGLNDMLERLERSIAGLRHAGDAIAHDLRSPLTRLRARLEAALIEASAGRGDAPAALRQALDDTDGLLRTFGAVLAIARLESAAAPPDLAEFDPAGLAADVAELYEPLCEDKGVAFSTDLTRGLAFRGNREFVAQALANLLDNAVKYTPPGGAVSLAVRRRETGEVEFAVTDTGPGVPPADRQRVVERFVRLESSRNQPGVGLGLSLVAAVARAHGGRLELDAGPGSADGQHPGLSAALVLPAG
jgi:signal transduction histidine kinase